MPVTAAYTDAATYRARLGKTDTAQDTAILEDLTAVSRFIDSAQVCSRFFTQDASAVARIYYPRGYYTGDPEAENPWRFVRGGRTLYVDDIASSAGLDIKVDDGRDGSFSGDASLAATDYQLFPLNADKGPEPKPWTSIHLPTWSTRAGWPSGCMVQVTAIFGWPQIPKAIVVGTINLTGILRLESPRATARTPEGLSAAFAESPEAQKIIEQLVRAYAGGHDRIYA